MSATNRGAEREPHDNYPTPPWCVERLLRHVPIPSGSWIDPCAGEGSIIKSVHAFRSDVTAYGMEIRPECYAPLHQLVPGRAAIGDFLATTKLSNFQAVVTNPPYSLAREFIIKSLEIAPYVALLMRVNILGSNRYDLLGNNMPDMNVLSNRPSFVKAKRRENGKLGSNTDATEYAWFIWGPERGKAHGQVKILPGMTLQERRHIDSWVLGGAIR